MGEKRLKIIEEQLAAEIGDRSERMRAATALWHISQSVSELAGIPDDAAERAVKATLAIVAWRVTLAGRCDLPFVGEFKAWGDGSVAFEPCGQLRKASSIYRGQPKEDTLAFTRRAILASRVG